MKKNIFLLMIMLCGLACSGNKQENGNDQTADADSIDINEHPANTVNGNVITVYTDSLYKGVKSTVNIDGKNYDIELWQAKNEIVLNGKKYELIIVLNCDKNWSGDEFINSNARTSFNAFNVSKNNKRYKSIDGVLFSKNGDTLFWYPARRTASFYKIPEGTVYIESDAFREAGPVRYENKPGLYSIEIPVSLTEIHQIAITQSGWANQCPGQDKEDYFLKKVKIPYNSKLKTYNFFRDIDTLFISAYAEKGEYGVNENNWDFTYCNVHPQNKYYSSVNGCLYNKNKTQLIKTPKNARIVNIPSNVASVNVEGLDTLAEAFIVDAKNTHLCSVDGVLFNKDKTILIAYPGSKKGSRYTVPKSVKEIGASAFFNARYLNELLLNEGLEKLDKFAIFAPKLKNIELPSTIKQIDACALRADEVALYATVPPVIITEPDEPEDCAQVEPYADFDYLDIKDLYVHKSVLDLYMKQAIKWIYHEPYMSDDNIDINELTNQAKQHIHSIEE